MRLSEARIPATAGSAAICAALTFTAIGAHPAEQAMRIRHSAVQLQSVSVGSPVEILTNLANAAIATIGAAAWYAAFPITLPASVGFAWWADAFRNAGFPVLRLDQLLFSGLQLFVNLPTYSVQNTFTQLGQSLGLIAPPTIPTAARAAAANANPTDIAVLAGDAIRTVAQAALWFAAFPITLTQSVIYGGSLALFGVAVNHLALNPLIALIGGSLQYFLDTPLKPVQAAFTALGTALGFTPAPAAAHARAAAARTETLRTAPAAATRHSVRNPAAATAHTATKAAKSSAAQRRHATPR